MPVPLLFFNKTTRRWEFRGYQGQILLQLGTDGEFYDATNTKLTTTPEAHAASHQSGGSDVISGGSVDVSGTPTDGQLAIWTDANTVEGAALGRVFVAANDATAAEKARAIASGTTVCDGTNDEVQIDAALALGYLVELSSGTFNIAKGSAITIDNNILRGQGCDYHGNSGTTLSFSNDNNNKILIQQGGKLQSLRILVPDAYTGIVVHIKPDETGGAQARNWDSEYYILDHVFIRSTTPATSRNGTGVKIEVDASTSDTYMELCHLGPFEVTGFSVGLHMLCTENSGQNGFLNGNKIEWFKSILNTTELKLETAGTGTPGVNGNVINAELHGGASVTNGLYIGASCNNNQIRLYVWDENEFSGAVLVAEAGCQGNDVRGVWGDKMAYESDADGANFFCNTSSHPKVRYQQDNLSTDEASGEIQYFTAAVPFIPEQMGAMGAVGKSYLADANVENYSKHLLSMAIGTVGSGNVGPFLVDGYIGGFTGLITGQPLYVSEAGGSISTFVPTATDGAYIRTVGFGGKDGSSVRIKQSSDFGEIGADGKVFKWNDVELSAERAVTHKTGDYTILLTEAGQTFTNKGASGTTNYTLPSTNADGLSYRFTVMAAQNMNIKIGLASKSYYAIGTIAPDDGGADLCLRNSTIGRNIELTSDGAGNWAQTSGDTDWALAQP